MKFTIPRMLTLIGGFITLAFGGWHSVVPWLYHWFDYMPSVPAELIGAIVATNFFLAVTLILLGMLAVVVATWQWNNDGAVKLVLVAMSVLWIVRTAYQVLRPQGTAIPGLSTSLAVVFFVTALCFLVPLLMRIKQQY